MTYQRSAVYIFKKGTMPVGDATTMDGKNLDEIHI